MSFVGILKKIVGIEQALAPALSILFPGYGPIHALVDGITGRLQNAIITGEVNDPRDGQGKQKAAATIVDFDAGLEFAQVALANEGKKLVYDEGKLREAIAAQVTAYNKFAELKASFKIVGL